MTVRQQLIIFISTLSAWFERIVILLWPSAVILSGTYAVIALGIVEGSIAKLVLFCALAASFIFVFRNARKIIWPTQQSIQRRIENASHFIHRPFGMQQDSPAQNDNKNSLWQAALKNAQNKLQNMRASFPEPQLNKRDTYALRFLTLIAAFVAIILTGQEGFARLKDASFLPKSWLEAEAPTVPTINILVTPPPYMGLSSINFNPDDKNMPPLEFPIGSKIDVKIANHFFKPNIKINNVYLSLQKIDDTFSIAQGAVVKDGSIKITQWPFTHVTLPFSVIPDNPPTLLQETPPRALPNGLIQLNLKVQDDYGVQALKVKIHAKGGPHWLAPEDHIEYITLLKSGRGKDETIQPVLDLTWHPQAGEAFDLRISAIDDLGQSVEAAPITFRLPTRRFQNTQAKLISTLRKELLDDTRISTARRTAVELNTLLQYPDDFNGKIPAFLGLRLSANRLETATRPAEFADAIALMWQSALTLEGDATTSQSMKNLKDAQKELSRIMNDAGATPEQIQQALQNYNEALMQSLQSLFEQMQKQTKPNSALSRLAPEMFSKPQSIDDLIRRMNEALQRGDKSKAAELFAQMQKMMDSLSSGASGEMPEGAEDMAKALEDLQALIDRQQDLLNQTEKQKELQKDGKSVETQKNAVEQDALRFILGQLMREMGENLPNIPENMAQAEQAMRSSSIALSGNLPEVSAPFQQKALDALNESQKKMQQQLKTALQNMVVVSPSGQPQRDALGRAIGKNLTSEPLNIPKESARRKVRDIIDKLREKSSDRSRTKEERDYYLRLLEQF